MSGDGTLLYKGLTRVLSRTCYPDYDYKKAKKKNRGNPRQKTDLRNPRNGVARGSHVHRQIQTLVRGGMNLAALRVAGGSKARVHAHTQRFFTALAKKGLIPFLSEFEDFYAQYGIASSIDLICLSEKTGRVCVVEIKTGGENYFCHSSAQLQNPPSLAAVDGNSPLNQAFLQLSVYYQMLVDHYPALALGSHYVAQICSDHVKFYRLPERFMAAAPELRDLLGSAMRT